MFGWILTEQHVRELANQGVDAGQIASTVIAFEQTVSGWSNEGSIFWPIRRCTPIFEEDQAAEDAGDTEDGQGLRRARRLSSFSNAIFLRGFLELKDY